MIFRQFVNEDLGCASYLVGDEKAQEAVVVDPAYAIERYLEQAERDDLRIVAVLETHTHADHVSGHGRFALERGTPVHVNPLANAEYPYEPLADGDEVSVGAVTLRAVHTPGHRPEHTCFAVIDHTRGDEPWLLLTGDSLFVGDAARPDLAVEAREGARDLFHSLHRLVDLGDGVEVFPGHVSGSLCGAGMSSKASTTIGFERRFNPALRIDAEDAFVDDSASITAPKPPNAERIVALNRGPFLGAPAPVPRLDDPGDAVVLDVRPLDAYLAGHAHGAISVPVDGSSFSTKAGFMLLPEEAIVIRAATEDEAMRAARGLRAVGVLDIAGYVLASADDEHTEPVTLDELEQLLADDAVEVLDVREPDEHADGFIPGSRNVPYRLVRRCGDLLSAEKPIVTVCESGPRAAVAASALAHEGLDARPVVDGGVTEWEERHATVAFRRCGD
ncbi:MAG TPA: MBL fold metallo-hydrolase, partial [Gaiellaceae bacterium]|nr:MBL fold metallo-hydrolase [Gaiellaceae bacterium]